MLESVDGMVGNWEFQQGEKQREQQVGQRSLIWEENGMLL